MVSRKVDIWKCTEVDQGSSDPTWQYSTRLQMLKIISRRMRAKGRESGSCTMGHSSGVIETLTASSSLHSDQSIQPLKITEELLRKILTFHDVDSSFMDVLLSFGDVPNLSEAGSSNISNVLLSDGSRSRFQRNSGHCPALIPPRPLVSIEIR